MKPAIRRATIMACAAVLTAGCTSAFARPSHHHHHRGAHSFVHSQGDRQHLTMRVRSGRSMSVNPYYSGPGAVRQYPTQAETGVAYAPRRIARQHRRARAAIAAPSVRGYSGSTLVADARRYIGTNPTGRRSLWCGAFMDKVLRETGHRGGGNLAKGYLRYGRRVAGPQVGAIAVMGRRGGGHVGVVSGVDANGNPIIISGNHNHTVAEATYPRSRIIAYVMPGG
jgi:uncharacterized protein (TIGR02594 family)